MCYGHQGMHRHQEMHCWRQFLTKEEMEIK